MRKKSPLKNKPLRLPGQSLDDQIDSIFDDKVLIFLLLAALPWLVAWFEWLHYWNPRPAKPWLYTIFAMCLSAYGVYRLIKIIPEIQNRARGRSGELVVGQILEKLRATGYEVFHDVPGEGFNVDHVLVGPGGVFTVETKTIGKPAKGKAIVSYDGHEIRLNDTALTRNPIDQAKAQSAWLSKLILDRTGRRVFVKPIVVFPGWYVPETIKDPPVWVLNELRIAPFINACQNKFNESDAKLIAAQLAIICTDG